MKTLGVHFGHDAAIAEIDDQRLYYTSIERVYRCRHAIGIPTTLLKEKIFDQNIDSFAFSTTQNVNILHSDAVDIKINGAKPENAKEFLTRSTSSPTGVPNNAHDWFKFTGWNNSELHSYSGLHVPDEKLSEVSHSTNTFSCYCEGLISSGQAKRNFKLYSHHYLHAIYAAGAACSFEPSIIITSDGGEGPTFSGGGIYFFTPERGLIPIMPIDGWIGRFYEDMCPWLGLGHHAGPGKLMGLAAYGTPLYYDDQLVGTRQQVTSNNSKTISKVIEHWLARNKINPHMYPWTDKNAVAPKELCDLAASVQLVFEKNMIRLFETAIKMAADSGFAFKRLSLAGGSALNCPLNSYLARTYPGYSVAPAVNDEGLAIGAAIMAWKEATGQWPRANIGEVYAGHALTADEVTLAAAATGWRLVEGNGVDMCAQLLREGAICGVISGRSEIGPRALGHRSIVGDPTLIDTWNRVNALKRREQWRPLAPAVLFEDSGLFFDCGPHISRHMLFNYRVTTKHLPSVTHFDHSARVQHVTEPTELFHKLLTSLKRTGPAVILNTSFNGPGVPIVDTARDAFSEAKTLGLSYILTDYGLYHLAAS